MSPSPTLPSSRALARGAVLGQAGFLGAWAVLGVRHDGFDPTRGTISVLAAHGAPGWPWMVAGFGTAAAAHMCTWALLPRRGLVGAGLLGIVAGSVVAAVARIDCGGGDTWCTAAPDHPVSSTLHAVGAAPALVLLALTPALAAWRPPLGVPGGALHRRVRAASATAAMVASAGLGVFVAGLADPGAHHGTAERVVTTAGGLWSAGLAVAAAYRGADGRLPRTRSAQPRRRPPGS